MKKSAKRISILALCIVMLMMSVVPAFAESQTESNAVVRTVQFGGQNLYLDKDSSNNAVALAKNDAQSQNFYFEYSTDKKAYKIYSAADSSIIVAWNTETTDNVFFTSDGNSDENYWVLEEDPSSDKCYLRNYAKDTDGYLTAENIQGSMSVVISEKTNSANHYTRITVSPSLRNDQTIGNNQYKIYSVAEPNKLLNRDVYLDVSIYSGNTGPRQNWIFEYSAEKDAYKIKNLDSNNLLSVLTWNSNENDNVYASNDLGNDDQFWRLEDVGNGNYVIKSYKDPNKVLDIYYLTSTSSDVRVKDRTNATTQQFKLVLISA